MRFQGSFALVTGASSGVGRAIALGLSREGAAVGLVGRDLSRLESVAGEGATPMHCYPADLSSDDQQRKLAESVLRDSKRVDVLVHAAGVISRGTVESGAIEEFDSQYRTNLRAPFLLTQLLLPALRQSEGQVVFINSNAALRPGAQAGQYAATKAGLRAVADSLRDEVNAAGVRVLTVFIGRTATPMQQALYESEGKPYNPQLLMQAEDVAEIVAGALALPRTTEVTEILLRPMKKG
jgi:short-subunit dehydrogenase